MSGLDPKGLEAATRELIRQNEPGAFADQMDDLFETFSPDAEKIVRAYLAHTAATLSDAWQPIETAPKDGTHIIVGTFPAPRGVVTSTTAHWFDSRAYGAKSGGAGWALSVNYDGEHSDYGVGAPTHWRPLPPPPRAEEA